MTTTATTNSASSSTSNDSPPMQIDNDASESIVESNEQHNQPCLGQSSQQLQQQQQEIQSPNTTESPRANSPSPRTTTTTTTSTETTTASTTTTTATTTSSSPTTATAATKQQSPSSQQPQQPAANSNNNTEQKRPMNAFLLFCKRQRTLVKEKYPNLENRGVTKILGDWWSKLDKEHKSKYTDLARQHKEAFMKANPNFKWCKTPNVSNINNNNGSSNNNTRNSNDCKINNSPNNHQQQPQHHHQLQNQQKSHSHKHQPSHHSTTATNSELLSLQSTPHPMDVMQHSSNSMDFTLTSRQQLEAPKPPKKRFLERNDSIYTSQNNYTSNHIETNSHGTDVVPYISLDQATLDRVIDKAFSEDSSNSPSGTNMCKRSNRTPANLTSSLGTNQTSFSSSSSTQAYSTNADEPVDFSMNRTINATRQQIIDNLVEKMISKPTDSVNRFSKSNGFGSLKSHAGHSVKKDNSDDT